MDQQKVKVTNRRYVVEKAPNGHSIIDTTGQDKPYTIKLPEVDEPRTPEALARSQEFNKGVCEHWAYVWNIVEMGYCGACQKRFEEGETRFPAVGFHRLDRIICYGCAASQE